MSQFSASVPPGGIMTDEDPKTSLAAILGFVISIVICLPIGTLGAVLGVFGLIGIRRSEGRVGGKGLAIAAIVIGLFSSVVWFGVILGVLISGRSVNKIGTQAGAFLTQIESGQYDESRSLLSGTLATADDASLAAFSEAVHANLGSFVTAPESLGSLVSGWFEFGPLIAPNQIPMSAPVTLQFENGRALVFYVFDRNDTAGGIPKMADLQVVELDGTVYRLSNFVTTDPAAIPPAGVPAETQEDTPPATDPTPTESGP